MRWKTLLLASVLAGLLAGLTDVRADEAANHFFESRIRPLLVARCYRCHSEQADRREGGLWLDRRDALRAGGDSGPTLVPGDPEASLLIQAVRQTDSDVQMPPDTRLRDDEIADLVRWVRSGAHDPRDGTRAPQNSVDPSDPIAGREHWAYQPLREVRPPELTDEQLSSPIDAFVLSTLQSAGLEPVETANPRTLVRRVFFQLVGLPPAPQQLDSYLNDRRPDAYVRLVDRCCLRHSLESAGDATGSIWPGTPTPTGWMKTSCFVRRGDTATGSSVLSVMISRSTGSCSNNSPGICCLTIRSGSATGSGSPPDFSSSAQGPARKRPRTAADGRCRRAA